MFLLILLPFLAFSSKFPKFSYLLVSESYTDEMADQMDQAWKESKDQLKQSCETYGDNSEECKAIVDAIQDLVLSNGLNLNSKMSKISKKTEFLFFMDLYTEMHTVDFNHLPTKMAVFTVSIDFNSLDFKKPQLIINKIFKKFSKKMIKASFDGSQKSILQLSKQFNRKKHTSASGSLTFSGNIKDKVSFLTIISGTITFEKNLSCDSFYLYSGKLTSYSDHIEVNHFIVDTETNENILKITAVINKIHVKEYSLMYIDTEYNYKYQISYSSFLMYLSCLDMDSDKFIKGWHAYQRIANSFCFIIYAHYIYIDVYSTDLDYYKNINVTIMREELRSESPFLLDETVKIVSSDEWKKVKNPPKIIVTLAKSQYDVDASELNIPYEIQEIYTYKLKGSSSVNIGLIVGIVVAVVVVIVIIIIVVVVVMKKKKKQVQNSTNDKEQKSDSSKTQQQQQAPPPQQQIPNQQNQQQYQQYYQQGQPYNNPPCQQGQTYQYQTNQQHQQGQPFQYQHRYQYPPNQQCQQYPYKPQYQQPISAQSYPNQQMVQPTTQKQ